jgi:DNA modification methylase
MPKTAEEIAESKRKRIEIANKYGGVPTSIWEIDYSIGKDINELHSKKQHVVSVDRHKKMDYDKRLYKHVAMSVQMVRGKGAGVSTFPPELVKRVESFYSEPGDTVLDLSAGHNSRMECTYQLGRNYIGYDPSIPFMAFNREVAEKLLNNKLLANGCTITLRQQSSEHLEEADNSVDLVFTSPPYWCLTPETLIITTCGVKQISDLCINDEVYTHNGVYKKVTKVLKRDINDELTNISVWGNSDLKITSNHKIYAVKHEKCPYYKSKIKVCSPDCSYLRCGNWAKHQCSHFYEKYSPKFIEAKDLVVGDFILYPINRDIEPLKEIRFSDFLKNLKVIEDTVKLNRNQYGNNDISDIIPLNKEVLRLFGYFLAEGYVNGDEITFSFHKNERDFIDDVSNIFKNIFNISGREVTQDNVCHLKFYKQPIADLFTHFFGAYSHLKHIPSFVMKLPLELQQSLIEGYYYGDGGHIQNSGYIFTSTSPTLIEQIKQLLLRSNIVFYSSEIDNTGNTTFNDRIVVRHKMYLLTISSYKEILKFEQLIKYKKIEKMKPSKNYSTQSFILGNYLYSKIRKIKKLPYNGEVFNCEVDEDNSYTLPVGSVHNCIEDYGDEPEQLGNNCTYDVFLDRMTTVLSEGHRVLKPGKFMIINVNDFMYEKEFYPYHADIINIYRRVGIPIHDIIIVKWKNSISQCFATKLEKWRRVAKLHEYLIVGRKNVV